MIATKTEVNCLGERPPDLNKMKKNRLEIDYSYDFELIGLTSSAKGYRLAWELNKSLATRFVKQPDLIVQVNAKNQLSYSHFLHETSLNTLRLFKNKPNEQDAAKSFLVPEHAHVDFILMAQGEEKDSNRLQEELKRIPSIEWVAFLPLDALKSKDNFIF